MPNYENETCEGCAHYAILNERVTCTMNDEVVCPGYKATNCEEFTPSLECRKVRALERLAKAVHNNDVDFTWVEVSTE